MKKTTIKERLTDIDRRLDRLEASVETAEHSLEARFAADVYTFAEGVDAELADWHTRVERLPGRRQS